MTIKINKLSVLIISILTSFCALFLITSINSYIFLDPIADKIVRERFDTGQIQLDSSNHSGPNSIDIQWPLGSIVFFVTAFSVYWFFYGRIIAQKNPSYPTTLIYLLPILFSIFIQEFYFIPVYILACYFGLKSVK